MSTGSQSVLVSLLLMPAAVHAQRAVDLRALQPELLEVPACSWRPALDGAVWETVLPPWDPDEGRLMRALQGLRDSLSLEIEARPGDVDSMHQLAMVLGTLTELQGASAKVRTAQELNRLGQRILSIDPNHAGTHHVLGRLHAAVMRTSRIERFIATRILGGSTLASASWDAARHHLEIAATRDPCIPDHQYELARLYAERGERERSVERLHDVLRIAPRSAHERHVAEKAERLLRDLGAR